MPYPPINQGRLNVFLAAKNWKRADLNDAIAKKRNVEPATAASKLSTALNETGRVADDFVDDVCALLDTTAAYLCPANYHAISHYSLDDIETLYDRLTESHSIWIVSNDGFLEASDRRLMEIMIRTVEKGCKVNYIFPDAEKNNIARNDYQSIYATFIRRIGTDKTSANVRGLSLSKEAGSLFGWNTRYVFVTVDKQSSCVPLSLFAYHQGVEPIPIEWELLDGHDHHSQPVSRDAWVRVSKVGLNAYFRQFQDSIYPIDQLHSYANRLPKLIQNGYRRIFGETRTLKFYSKMREYLGVEARLRELMNGIVRDWWAAQKITERAPNIKYLDIGAGDGVPSLVVESILKETAGGASPVQTTLCEPASIRDQDQSPIYKYSVLYNDTFEQWDAQYERFDFITAIHSFYVIDPTYLKKLYGLLSNDGFAVILLGTYKDNFFNILTSKIDEKLAQAHSGLRILPFEGKAVTQDPDRVYAEDIEKFFEDEIGSKPKVQPLPDGIPVDALVDSEGELTQFAIDAISTFSQGLFDHKEITAEERRKFVLESIAEAGISKGNQELVNCHSLGFIINRQELDRALKATLFGRQDRLS